MNEIIGVTFPIPKQLISRFFKDGKSVFIKPAKCFKFLKPGMKFVFYQSHDDTGFFGEAKIVSLSIADDPLEFIDKFGDRLFLTRDEIIAYYKKQEKWRQFSIRKDSQNKKKWMAIELSKIQRYPEILKPSRFISVGGRYLRK